MPAPLLRCCNNGITCWFDAQGRMREIFRDQNGSEYGVGFATWNIPFKAVIGKQPEEEQKIVTETYLPAVAHG